jgi:hypothetical protein
MQSKILGVLLLVVLLMGGAYALSTMRDTSDHTSPPVGAGNVLADQSLPGSKLESPQAITVTVYLPLVMRGTGIEIGAFVGASPPTTSTIQAFENLMSRHIYSVLWYQGWDSSGQPPFSTADLNTGVRYHDGYDTRTVLHLTWEPWVDLKKIADGTYDTYLFSYAAQARDWGDPIRLRFAHEMIQNNVKDACQGGQPGCPEWYPWQDQPDDYKAAFRHVHDVFRAAGATNVEFVWCPQNYPFDLNIVEQYYPGSAYVDWLCADGYNTANPWQWFDDIFYNIYHTFVDHPEIFGDKPVMIGEFASCEAGPDEESWETKPTWIQNAFERIQSRDYAKIRAFYWFQINKECDWRINSSSASLAAFRTAISGPAFASHPISSSH